MLTRRRLWLATAIAAALAAMVAFLLLFGGASTTSGHHVPIPPTGYQSRSAAPQPQVPQGWGVQRVGIARVAVPDGWVATRTGVVGTTVAVWWPGPPSPGMLPSRCAIQDRPQWLLTFLNQHGDWPSALRADLASMQATTTQSGLRSTVSDLHLLNVRGAAAALAFTTQVTGADAHGQHHELQSADLLAALSDGTEVHVYCSGPIGTLPANFADGVDSVTLG